MNCPEKLAGLFNSLEKRCHCEESSTKQSPDTDEIASQSLAMTLPFYEN